MGPYHSCTPVRRGTELRQIVTAPMLKRDPPVARIHLVHQGCSELFQYRADGFRARFGQKQSELVSPKSSNEIHFAEDALHGASHFLQNQVSGFVTFEVIHEFEVVKVDIDNRERVQIPLRALTFIVKYLEEPTAVQRTRQVVLPCQLLRPAMDSCCPADRSEYHKAWQDSLQSARRPASHPAHIF